MQCVCICPCISFKSLKTVDINHAEEKIGREAVFWYFFNIKSFQMQCACRPWPCTMFTLIRHACCSQYDMYLVTIFWETLIFRDHMTLEMCYNPAQKPKPVHSCADSLTKAICTPLFRPFWIIWWIFRVWLELCRREKRTQKVHTEQKRKNGEKAMPLVLHWRQSFGTNVNTQMLILHENLWLYIEQW